MARTKDAVSGSRRDTGIVGGSATTGWPAPACVADAQSALAGTVIRAQLALMAIAGEVVALAKVSRYYLKKCAHLYTIYSSYAFL